MPHFFLSYARADQDFALRLATDLRSAGHEVWVDQLHILPSQRWDRMVEAALRDCVGLLLVLSPRSVASENVLDEIGIALDIGRPVIPVMVEKCAVPLRLARVQFIDATGDYAAALARCKAVLAAAAPTSQDPAAPDMPPPATPTVAPAPMQAASVSPAPAGDFDPAFLDRVAVILTHYLGPMSRHIVARDHRTAADRDSFYRKLAERVPHERERDELLRKLRAI